MSVWTTLQKRATRALTPALRQVAAAADPDKALMVATEALIERARVTYPRHRGGRWRPGEPLRLLFTGYNGTRNTGADVRVEEMIRQFRHVLGPELDLTIHVHDPSLTRGYFRTAKQVQVPRVFPLFLYEAVLDVHGVVACEGSMFKSKFADALSAYMAGSLGLAAAGDKLAIAYGGEAGKMSPALEGLVRRTCQDAFVLCRNEASREVLGELGLRTWPGTDTAWTFQPSPDEVGQRLLREAGWDGHKPVLLIAPINPFWWPVRPDLGKAAQHALFGAHDHDHYASVYFHRGGRDVAEAQEAYLRGLAAGVRAFADQHDVFIALVAMEQLDRRACEQLAPELEGAPVFASDTLDMFDLVSVLRQASYLVSSRYHALVTAMPAGVPGVGVTMDERIANLLDDVGAPGLCVRVDDEDLGVRVRDGLLWIAAHREAHRRTLLRTVANNLVRMGRMGQLLSDHVRDRLPGFPLPEGRGRAFDPWDHLPPLPPDLAERLAPFRTAALEETP